MATILDYLNWRGDLPIATVPLTPVDQLILARVSYLPLAEFLNDDLKPQLTFQQLSQKLRASASFHTLSADDQALVEKLGQSPRFQSMALFAFKHKLDYEQEQQFAAVAIQVNPKLTYLSFRGTSDSLVGLKEDFNMTFLHTVPAQVSARYYVQSLLAKRPGRFILGGHSKGGNLATFAACFLPEDLSSRIDAAVSFDGPRLNQELRHDPYFHDLSNKIHHYIPQSSIVGMLMNDGEAYHVVKSSETGLTQHNVYNWQVQPHGFVELQDLDPTSLYLDKTIHEWLASATKAERRTFIDTIYQLLRASGVSKWSELSETKLQHAWGLLTSYVNVDKTTRKIIIKTIGSLLDISRKNYRLLRQDNKRNENLETK